MVRCIILASAILLAGPELVGAQSTNGLAAASDAGDTVAVSPEATENLELRRSLRSNAGKGAVRGALIGGVVGGLAGVLAQADNCVGGCVVEYGPEAIPLFALRGAILGGTIGFLIGSLSKSERWEPPRSDFEIIGRGAGAGGVHLGLAVSF